jgi:putative Holliday junction resolvase
VRILAVDLGGARTGLAVSDENEVLASPAGVVAERNRERLARAVAAEARRRGAGLIVVGLPRNMDGSEGESAKKARAFAGLLRAQVSLPIVMQDERGTTVTAHNYLNDTNTRGRKRRAVIDAVAATIILQDYLSSRRRDAASTGPPFGAE